MSQFHISYTDIPGLLTIRPHPVPDDRGWFMRSFSAEEYATAGIHQSALVQENHSRSRHGVLRGLHTRAELSEAKLVRAARGRIFDVAVDLRPGSPLPGAERNSGRLLQGGRTIRQIA
jgi:dTDP-4-dehydrorhamnose 3,5-epimerase